MSIVYTKFGTAVFGVSKFGYIIVTSSSPSSSQSPSSSSSSSISLSISSSISGSVSSSQSPSSSESSSSSSSISPSPSSSTSSSLSSSESSSISSSQSISESSSISPSPSPGYQEYTKGDYVVLPTNNNNLTTPYTSQDYTDVSTEDEYRVSQTGLNYQIHQFKDFVTEGNSCVLTWIGQTDLAPSTNTVYLQIYNHNTNQWDTLDSDNSSSIDIDFTLTANILDLTDYKDGSNVISCRVYQ